MPQVPGVMWVQAGGEVSDRPGTHRSGSLSTGSSIGRLFQPAEEACEVSRRVIAATIRTTALAAQAHVSSVSRDSSDSSALL